MAARPSCVRVRARESGPGSLQAEGNRPRRLQKLASTRILLLP
jgi:hypothetical protein